MWGSVEEKGTVVAELLGQHRYQLDQKGRIALPVRFRDSFQDGLYLVLLDGREQRNLDEQIFLGPDSHVTFLRLTALAGA